MAKWTIASFKAQCPLCQKAIRPGKDKIVPHPNRNVRRWVHMHCGLPNAGRYQRKKGEQQKLF